MPTTMGVNYNRPRISMVWGECYNPTEAGSSTDAHASGTSSRLLSLKIVGKNLKTATKMAYWRYCPDKSDPLAQEAKQKTSQHIFFKDVTIGYRRSS